MAVVTQNFINHIRYCKDIYDIFDNNEQNSCGEFDTLFVRICEWGIKNMPDMQQKYGHIQIKKNGDPIYYFVSSKDIKKILIKMLMTENNDKEFEVNNIENKESFIKLLKEFIIPEGSEDNVSQIMKFKNFFLMHCKSLFNK